MLSSRNNICLLSLVVSLVMILSSLPDAHAASIDELYKASAGNEEFVAPDSKELETAEELFVQTIKGAVPTAQLKKRWHDLRFDLVEIDESGKSWIILKEQERYRTGRGFYLIHKNSQSANLLQMPHRFHDRMTGEIGVAMIRSGGFAIGAWNSVPRWRFRDGVKIESDLAHRDNSYLTALTSAFLRLHPAGAIIQLHGYEVTKRKQAEARDSDAIISSGSRSVNRRVRTAAACIRQNSNLQVLIYPEDVRELGGTTNSIGRLASKSGNHGFVHLELSDAYRKKLVADRNEQDRLGACLGKAQ